MARSRPTSQDHDAVVMDVGDPPAPPRDDGPDDAGSDDGGPGARGAHATTTPVATPPESAVEPPGGGTTMDPVSMEPVSMDPDLAVDGPGAPDGRGDTPAGDGRGWLVPAAVAVLAVALATAGWTLLRDDPLPLAWWSAPTTPVAERWSMELSTMRDGRSQVVPVGDDLLVQRRRRRPDGGPGTGLVLERRDGRTGDVTWSQPGRGNDLVMVLDEGRPTSRLLYPGQDPRRVVGIDGATGEELWTQPANDQSWGGVTRAGDVWVSGDRGCGLVHPPTGRMLFTVGRDADECGPAGDGLAFSNGDERVVVDRTGEVVDRVPVDASTYGWSAFVDGISISLDGRDLVAREPDGTENWRRRLGGGEWWWTEPVGPDLLFVLGERETLLVRRVDGTVTARVDGQVDPLVTAGGRVRLVADRSRTSPEEASGVWSRSPDAADYALLDETGEVLGTQDLVLTGWPITTAQGVLTVHGPDDRRRMSLFDPDDLSVRWQVPLALRNGEVIASSESLVVVEGARGGRTEVVVFGPEG